MNKRFPLAVLFIALVAAVGCGFGPPTVAACEASIDAHNDLECVDTTTFRNAQDECAVLARSREEVLADATTPRVAKSCAQDFSCTADDLAAYYECQESSWTCDENGFPVSADSCDDHLPS